VASEKRAEGAGVTGGAGGAGGGRPRLLLLDGHSMAYRAWYAFPVESFATSTGQPTNAVYGFASMLANILRDEQPSHFAVAFDVSRKTFRAAKYPEYKANRAKTPDEFRSQIDLIGELLDALRVPHMRVTEYEADDIIATLAGQAEAAGYEVLILTGDRDALQLVNENVTVLYPTKGVSELTRYTPSGVEEKYGVPPKNYPDLAALRGDPSDNLPGIPGVGEKTAAKWILQFGSLEELIERADEIKGKTGEKFRAGLDDVKRNRELTELIRNVELPLGVDELTRRPFDREATAVLLDALEFRNQALRDRLFAADPGAGEEEAAASSEAVLGVQLDGLRAVEPGRLADWLGRYADGRRLGLAAEFEWSRGEGGVSAVALAAAEGPAVWFDPAGADEADERAFAAWAADPEQPKAVHIAKHLTRVFAEHGWELDGIVADDALAAYLEKPGRRTFGLDALAEEYLGRQLTAAPVPAADGQGQLAFGVDESEGGQDGEGGAEAAAAAAAEQLMLEARTALDLGAVFDERLAKDGADSLLRDVELPTSALLARMERAGIAADEQWLRKLESQFAAAVPQAVEAAHDVVGHEFNLGSPKQLQEVLFGELGLPKTKKIKTGYTTDADALAWLAAQTDNELPVILLRHRDQTRLRTTVEGLIKTVGADGRIHTTFNQMVAATGRLSSQDPNLQNIPVRTEEGRMIRRAFVVGEGYETLLTADYSQIELRVMAHLSEDEGLLAAFAGGEDLHTTVGSYVFDVPAGQVDAEMRRKVKAMSYGLAYGLSAFGLSQQLGIEAAEARRLMDTYFERFGGVRDYLRRVVDEARSTGYTETLLGRRRYLPDLTSDNRQRREMAERMALNAPIQGSAADIVKIAMLRVEEALREAELNSRMLLQVHDEIVVEVAPGERDRVEELVRERMSGAYPLRAPLDVSVGCGENWEVAAH
jgi:DNA polymerase-1